MAGVVVTNKGLDVITNRMVGSGSEPKYIHWGTGTSGPSKTDTALGTARSESRVAGSTSRVTSTVANDTYQVKGILVCQDSPAAITEVGLFDAATGGNLFLRAVFAVNNLEVGDEIEFTIRTQFKSE